jgi:hypothetical protein
MANLNKEVFFRCANFNEEVYQKTNTSFPAWFSSDDKFMSSIEQIGEIIFSWKTPCEVWFFEGEDKVLDDMIVRVS